ncbi:MFS general substrate transporter [Dacryopinax primogenitus]|uniref:MFS general substrate transporter n=1 Tax=Dacryopinax primogenitus (strain DJM 731) TaxID=1858805 RepID=M5FXU9_DACPD|nr:MFS general substrate transporter [Dacryopinax primogenitus]EJU01334.1 MFS general substrate transporter [Dacryopinax primogenitus]
MSTTITTTVADAGYELQTFPSAARAQSDKSRSIRLVASEPAVPTPATATATATAVSEPPGSGDDSLTARQASLKLLSCCVCFLVAGLNDGSLGALLPYLIGTYNISPSLVGIMYGTSFAGWALAAGALPFTVALVGARGALLVGACLYALSQLVRIWTPPFPLFATTFFLASLAQAYQDAQANTFVASIKASHLWLGLIHAMYSLGLLVAPLVANTIAAQRAGQWALYYSVPFGIGLVNIALVLLAFFTKEDIRMRRRAGNTEAGQQPTNERYKQTWNEMKETVTHRSVWLISLFYFFYLGASFTIGGWIVLFLTDIRGLPLQTAGYIPTGYYLGTFLGRLFLPHPTHTWLGGEHYMLTIYCLLILCLQLLSWLVTSAISTSVAISLMGLLFGPWFAAGMQVSKQVMPRKIRPNALPLIFVIAQLGASVFPAVTGVIVASKGVGVLQPIALGLIVLTGGAWWFVPTAPREREREREAEAGE